MDLFIVESEWTANGHGMEYVADRGEYQRIILSVENGCVGGHRLMRTHSTLV